VRENEDLPNLISVEALIDSGASVHIRTDGSVNVYRRYAEGSSQTPVEAREEITTAEQGVQTDIEVPALPLPRPTKKKGRCGRGARIVLRCVFRILHYLLCQGREVRTAVARFSLLALRRVGPPAVLSGVIGYWINVYGPPLPSGLLE